MNAVEYQRRAMLHKPTDGDSIAAEVRRLKANGYSARDISGALNLDYVAVEQMLRYQPSPGVSINGARSSDSRAPAPLTSGRSHSLDCNL
jgi:hypothetical protein